MNENSNYYKNICTSDKDNSSITRGRQLLKPINKSVLQVTNSNMQGTYSSNDRASR